MHIAYKISITDPQTHYVKMRMEFEHQENFGQITLFLPVWSPGSYLVREYSRHIRSIRASDELGNRLYIEQSDKCRYMLDFEHKEFVFKGKKAIVEYEVYCKELTVRTSHVDITHAFLHGPSLYMSIENEEVNDPTVELDFPPLWSHVSTTLKDISDKREKFIYSAKDYDELLDSPIEIGCQETDGFMYAGKEHWWVYWGKLPALKWNLKEDLQKIVATVSAVTGEVPYQKYMFLAHFAPDLYGGLEHSDSTVLAFDPFKMVDRKNYLDWLALVAHEYFHVWNVKRIRPKALGPFDYTKENYTSLLWLSEGLTVFMDELFVFRAGLSTLSEYLDQQKTSINRLLATPGRRFHSLEDSSFNAWVKLYRPDENFSNSSVSYYLKGGLAFFVLNSWLSEQGKSVDHFVRALWSDYKEHPERGIERYEVFDLLESVSDEKTTENFAHLIASTDELPLDDAMKKIGLEIVYEQSPKAWTGLDARYDGERVLVERVTIDGPAAKGGLNAGDEIISIGGLRVMKNQWNQLGEWMSVGTHYEVLIARHGQLTQVSINPEQSPKIVKEIKVLDEAKAKKALLGN